MERKADLPPTTKDGVASRLSSSPPPDFLRHVQAAFKRHKPLSMLPANVSRARRVLVPQSESMKNAASIPSAPEKLQSNPASGLGADVRISNDTRIKHLSSHSSSIALPESECNLGDQVEAAVSIQVSTSAPEASAVHDNNPSKGQGSVAKEDNWFIDRVPDQPKAVCSDEKSTNKKEVLGGTTEMRSQAPQRKHPSSNVNWELSQSSKLEKASGRGTSSGTRKKSYDPDVFFKVNGTLYQKLGKIGSGGSSEVFKVISSDCTIYALKKIKLKGRDYSTACGFCQEIRYLEKLKGKKNIIQLIDYEV